MTQLVGRILRQPHAEKTGVQTLDECYVITHHADTANVVQAIKQGLEEDGLGDLIKEIKTSDPKANGKSIRTVQRRTKFQTTNIYLPLVLRVENGSIRQLDYDADILYAIEWRGLDPGPLVSQIPENARAIDSQMRRIRLSDSGAERIITEVADSNAETLNLDPTYMVRMVSDIVPNPWIARDIIGIFVSRLKARGFSEVWLGEHAGLIVEELRKWLEIQRDIKAEALFRTEVKAGRIQFRLRADGKNWQMPIEAETYEPENARQLVGKNGGPLERSLFAPIYEGDFSSQDERDIAVYLDGDEALRWWHRNVARKQFSVQGWRREKIYPDFIFAVQNNEGSTRTVVLEMKGIHLAGNADTEYKKAVLQLVSQHFGHDTTIPAGKLEIFKPDGERVECDLVLMNEWKTRLPIFLKG
jgi:type III restriction enzyme